MIQQNQPYVTRSGNVDDAVGEYVGGSVLDDRYQIGSLGKREAFISGLVGVAYKTNQSKFKINLMHLQNGESRAGSFFQEYLWENSVELYKDNLEYTQRQISNVLLEGKHSNSSGNFIVDWKISPTLSKVTDPDLRLTPFRWDEQKYTIEPSESGDPTRIWRYLDEYILTGKVDLTKNYSIFNRESKFKIGSTYTFKERDFEILNYRVYIRKEYLYSCLLYTSPSPRDGLLSRMPSSA